MNMQRVEALIPGEHLHEVKMAGGGSLKARTIVLATGARWREMNVPGETGDGNKVNGLTYTNRLTNESHHLELEGIFVQIGLLPNTDFLKGTLNLSKYGEIEIDARCETSVPGIYAAGDATTVPYKQIIIAMGEGAKASLSAFDHLIRSSAG